MRLPPARSRQRQILAVLVGGAVVTPEEGVLLHGRLRASAAVLADLYVDLVLRGCAERVGQRYRASQDALAAAGAVPAPPTPTGVPVPAATVPAFRPLDRRHIPSVRGMREGSNDLRDAPSLHLPRGTR